MADPVNLRLFRKRKARAEKELQAAENRALHGRTKSERQRERLEAEKSASLLDAHRLESATRGEGK